MFLCGRPMVSPTIQTPNFTKSQNKKHILSPLFLLLSPPQKKKLSKRKAPRGNFALCGARQRTPRAPSRRRQHTCFAYVSIPLLISFCRLAATGANKVAPDRSTIAYHGYRFETLNADSDSLLCHVWLRQTSRELTDSRSERGRRRRDRVFKFGCVSRCEHSKIGFISAIYYSNTSSVAVNRATFSHWRRLIKHTSADCIDEIPPSVLMRLFIFRK